MYAPAPRPTADMRTTPAREPPPMREDRHEIEWESLLIAGFGAACALLLWLICGALTGLGKLSSWIFPVAVIVALIGAVVGLTRAAIALWILTALSIVAFCIVAMTPFVTTILPTSALVRRDNLPANRLDAVIVLSGGITPEGLLMPEPLDRLLSGLELMRDGIAPVLVVTEPERSGHAVTAAADQARIRALVARPFAMLAVDSVHTTHDEAVNSWRLLQPRGAFHVAVVTSPLHTRRACATFEKVGFLVTCVPAVSRAYSVRFADTGVERLVLFREWLYERAAWIEYRARHWVPDPVSR
jgi:uncharacterized SAM-binding protein YcdF (DUF218 family)